ncbi:MAG: DUF1254 domain-containing protein [Alphaproteobacteria bacterium]|nr:DUF1254 domain-containing protein [Alphaproteobacteria bacterium]
MTVGRRALLAGCAASVAAPFATGQARTGDNGGLRQLAHRAAVYFTPLSCMFARRHRDTVELGHKLNNLKWGADASDGVLAGVAWLDLSIGPLFLTLPPMGERFYSAAFIDPFTNAFAHVSSRMSRQTPPACLIADPSWDGSVESDVTLLRAPASVVWLQIRIAATDSRADLEIAQNLQARSLLETPDKRNERRILEMRELMRFRTYAPAEPVIDWDAPRPEDRFDLLNTGLALLAACRLSEADREVLDDLAPLRLHVGRRFDARAFNNAEREAIASGLADAAAEIAAAGPSFGEVVDGWRYPGRTLGQFGTDYLYRAFIATTALGALVPAEILDLVAEIDGRFEPPSPLPAKAVRWLADRRIARFFQPDASLLDGRYRLAPPMPVHAPT